jgi:hypothetical protein
MTIAAVAVLALSATDAFAQNTRANANANAKLKRGDTFTVLPTVITSVTVARDAAGVPFGLVANGLVGMQPFSAPLLVSVSDEVSAAAACPILNLELAPIHLDVLGLVVDTSAICLDVTANSGQGLLGDLLCGIAGLLSSGSLIGGIDGILAGLTESQIARLDRGLTQLFNQSVFIPASQTDALQTASCDILNLALGPLDLNLLGLQVELDDCADGPVTVDISARAGALLGDLLGGLLCNLGGAFNGSLTPPVLAVLRNVADLINSILALGAA